IFQNNNYRIRQCNPSKRFFLPNILRLKEKEFILFQLSSLPLFPFSISATALKSLKLFRSRFPSIYLNIVILRRSRLRYFFGRCFSSSTPAASRKLTTNSEVGNGWKRSPSLNCLSTLQNFQYWHCLFLQALGCFLLSLSLPLYCFRILSTFPRRLHNICIFFPYCILCFALR